MTETYREMTDCPKYLRAIWIDKELQHEGTMALPLWGKDEPPAPIGTEIMVTMNGLGAATVTGYFVEHGWLGLLVRLHNAPAWHRKQNHNDPKGHIFAIEYKLAA